MKITWATDTHLDMAKVYTRNAFYDDVAATGSDALVITGDIAHGHCIEPTLMRLRDGIAIPTYFVLGNHDFYHIPHGLVSVAETRRRVVELCEKEPNLHYLSTGMIVELSPTTALVGHDGWLDGREGNWKGSRVWLNDYVYIADYKGGRQKHEVLAIAQQFAAESASYIEAILVKAFEKYDRVICATHVPPFREAAWHDGGLSDPEWMPHFSSRVIGEAIRSVMEARPDKQLLVLCGHTHGRGEAKILDNLNVWTGHAAYGKPEIQCVIDPDGMFDVRPAS